MSPSRWQEVAEIFERVLDCPPHERATLLNETCGTRDSLRTEIESLLAAHGSAGESFLDDDMLVRQAASVFPQGLPPDLSGQSIKHFVLRERLGVGGMGEVYLAEDTNLRRLVALKLLSSRVRLDEEHLRRFAREARAASLLNHPNITTVYEFGEDGGRPYIVTEYVAGQTLRARLLQKDPLPPISLDQALDIADQMLAALASAHAVGIIHRDIKPENLMLRPDGVVKVLDFGIAKLTPRATGAAAATQFRSTEQGMVLGTPGYMSPEQARAQEVTARSDLFSFGVVLYEMLVGNLPFHTETKADYIATLLTMKPVPLSEKRPDLSRAYNTLLNRLLARDPAGRPASAEETRKLLDALPRRLLNRYAAWGFRHRRVWAGAAAALLCCTLAVFGVWRWRENTGASAALRAWSDLSRIRRTEIYSNRIERGFYSPAFSPDGQWIAMDKAEGGVSHLYLLPRQGGTTQQLTFGKTNDAQPLWSPDGERLAFVSNRSGAGQWGIWTIARTGGEPELLWSLPSQVIDMVSWRAGAQGNLLYFAAERNLYVLNLRRRVAQPLTTLPAIKGNRLWFSLSPEGGRLIYIEQRDDANHLCLLDLGNGESVTLLKNQGEISSLHWLPDGKNLAFIMSVAGTLQPHLFSIAERKAYSLNLGNDDFADIALTADGQTMLGRTESQYANVYTINRAGQETSYTTEKELHLLPLPSPDGKHLLYHSSSGYSQYGGKLIERSLDGSSVTRQQAALSLYAQWSPDGQRLAYVHPLPNRRHELEVVERVDSLVRLVIPNLMTFRYLPLPYYLLSSSLTWAPDSQHLVYVSRETDQCQLWRTDLTGSPAQPLSPPGPAKTEYSTPVCAPVGPRVAFISAGRKDASKPGFTYQLAVAENGQVYTLHEAQKYLRLLGWLQNNEALLIGEGSTPVGTKWQAARLLKCQVSARHCQPIASLPQLLLPSLQLSPDKTTVAFVAQSQQNQNIHLLTLATRQTRLLTNNSDPGLFYSGLQWTHDSQRLFFSKQNAFEILTLIELR